jgi:hypothetical protein
MVSLHATKGECASHKSSNNWWIEWGGGWGDEYIKLKPQQFVKKGKKTTNEKTSFFG